MQWKEIMEKGAAFIFLIILVGLIGFLTFVPMPAASEKVILMIVGSLLTASIGALPRLFGTENVREKELEMKVRSLENSLHIVESKYEQLQAQHDKLVSMLVERHVVHGEGIEA